MANKPPTPDPLNRRFKWAAPYGKIPYTGAHGILRFRNYPRVKGPAQMTGKQGTGTGPVVPHRPRPAR
jgi:hypothetical protein